jgi:methylated-DNA-protein-cysteine methyltransferase-like protein
VTELPPKGRPWPDGHQRTPFQDAVVQVVAELRSGDLVTFADIADAAGHPGAAQAVANVLRSAPGLPWWRVVPGDGRVYRTHRGAQVPLLRAEGHEVGDDGTLRDG